MKIPNWVAWTLLTLPAMAGNIEAFAGPEPPTGLLVNGVTQPLAVQRDAVRFSWRSADSCRGARQTAYQLLLSTNLERLGRGTGDWWDSGRVDSDQSASVVYAGKGLSPATRFWWKVRVWDQAGKASPYSAPAFFDTGLNQNEWTAHYLWDGTTNLNNFAYFRKAFALSRKPSLAKVYVTAHNDYVLYFNGHLLGRGPARCDPYHYGQYNAYDVTKLVKTGTNVFAAKAHWWGNWNLSGVNAQPAFLLEARLDCPDGSSSKLGTDGSWKVLAHTAFLETDPVKLDPSSHRRAIQFDARLEPAGWQTMGFNDSNWDPATVVERSDFRPCAQMAPMQREQAELEPLHMVCTNGAWLVDFGRCIDGWPKLTMRQNRAGDKVRVRYFQMTGQRYPAGWDEYTCRGGTETWDADFGRHTSFQQLKITGYAGKLRASDVRGIWAYCDAEVAGRFHCSSSLLNAIYEMCERSARQNIQEGIISVDANREQAPWLADSWNIGNVLLYNHRDTTMMDKVVRDYAAEQFPSGFIPACSPAHRLRDYPAPGEQSWQIPEWSLYWPMLLWEQYLFSGDEGLLRGMAPHLTRLLEWIKPFQDPATGLLNPPGWRISDYTGGNLPDGGYNIVTSCQYYQDLRIASRLFSVLGETNQSEQYGQQAQAVKTGINTHLFNGQYYLARTDRKEMFPLASAWALRFELEPAADKSKILVAVEAPGTADIGGYGGDAFYSGMLIAGGGAFVVRDLERYRPMLEGNQACWESFHLVRDHQPNHAWTAYPAYIFQKYICGIQPTSGGFATFDVRPETGGLTFAEGAVPTVKGLITTRWEKGSRGRFTLSVNVPPNTRATIHLPKLATRAFTVTESGKRLWPAVVPAQDPGVLAVSEADGCIKCLVGSGAYQFVEAPAGPQYHKAQIAQPFNGWRKWHFL